MFLSDWLFIGASSLLATGGSNGSMPARRRGPEFPTKPSRLIFTEFRPTPISRRLQSQHHGWCGLKMHSENVRVIIPLWWTGTWLMALISSWICDGDRRIPSRLITDLANCPFCFRPFAFPLLPFSLFRPARRPAPRARRRISGKDSGPRAVPCGSRGGPPRVRAP